jgi:glycosyltransferase involved in cell wall biosynthesis
VGDPKGIVTQPGSRPYLSVAVLAFNEVDTVEEAAQRCSRALEALERPHEIVLMDDGSTDGTTERIRELAERVPHCRALFHSRNLGVAAAMRTCLLRTTGEWVTWFPADLQADPSSIPELATQLDACDVLVTYRDHRKRSEPIFRRAMSALERLAVRVLLGVSLRDLHWVRFFRRELLDRMELRCKSPCLDTEMILEARRMGARILEVPLGDRPRLHGAPKAVTWRSTLRTVGELIGLRLGTLPAPRE